MPSPAQVHVDAAASQFVFARPNNRFIAEEIFPVVGFPKKSDKLFAYDTEGDRFRQEADIRAPGSEAAMVDFDVNSDLTYNCQDHALAAAVSWEEMANADDPIRPFLQKSGFLADKIAVNKEIALLAKLVAGLTGALTGTPSTKWDPTLTGDPLTDVSGKITLVSQLAGVRPNRVAFDISVLDAIAQHPDYIDRVKAVLAPGEIRTLGTAEILAQIWNVEKVVVARGGYKNTAVKGQPASYTPIWSDYVLIYHFDAPAGASSNLGVHPVWQAAPGSVGGGMVVERWVEEKRKSDVTRVSQFYDQIFLNTVAGARAGFLFSDVLA